MSPGYAAAPEAGILGGELRVTERAGTISSERNAVTLNSWVGWPTRRRIAAAQTMTALAELARVRLAAGDLRNTQRLIDGMVTISADLSGPDR